jgi:hypothetical protein
VHEQRVARRNKPLCDHTNRPQPAIGRERLASKFLCKFHSLYWFSRSLRMQNGNFVSAKLQLCHSATKFPGTIVEAFSRCDCAVPFVYNPASSICECRTKAAHRSRSSRKQCKDEAQ